MPRRQYESAQQRLLARADKDLADQEGDTALILASGNDRLDMMGLLLAADATMDKAIEL